ncbi:DUF448 domain-containing protein [Ureaplasma sp. ES3154-GEN]|uniref:DUF448 domain-containing protein n=1 Tax=Ureaplasma sp. ES3154-GEN TaxID=2984844 RepID=UPI003FCE372D
MRPIISIRTCVKTRHKYPQTNLLRFIITREQYILFNQMSGRGYYIMIDQNTDLKSILTFFSKRFGCKNLDMVAHYLNAYQQNLLK